MRKIIIALVVALGVIVGLSLLWVLLLMGVIWVAYSQSSGCSESYCVKSLPSERVVEGVNVPLAAVFAGWYGFDLVTGEHVGGVGSTHWGDDADPASVIHRPYPGYYCSADPKVVGWQLEQMWQAGISVVLYSWWGWGDIDLDGEIEGHADQYMNDALVRMLGQMGSDMKFAIIVEPFTSTQAGIHPDELTEKQKRMVLDYVWDKYYAVYRDKVFEWQGSPLVITFDPMTLPADERYTVKKWTGRAKDEVTVREGWDWFFAPPQDVIEGMSSDGVVFVYPRFDEQYAAERGARHIRWDPRKVDPCLAEGIYEKQWQQLIDNREQVSLIVLYSWNVYGEQTQIEPSTGGPASVEGAYVEKTRELYERFLGSLR